jgi:hypothetical protein
MPSRLPNACFCPAGVQERERNTAASMSEAQVKKAAASSR